MIVAGRLCCAAAAIVAVACRPSAVDSGRVHVEAAIAASRDARPDLDRWMESFHRRPSLAEVPERLREALERRGAAEDRAHRRARAHDEDRLRLFFVTVPR